MPGVGGRRQAGGRAAREDPDDGDEAEDGRQ